MAIPTSRSLPRRIQFKLCWLFKFKLQNKRLVILLLRVRNCASIKILLLRSNSKWLHYLSNQMENGVLEEFSKSRAQTQRGWVSTWRGTQKLRKITGQSFMTSQNVIGRCLKVYSIIIKRQTQKIRKIIYNLIDKIFVMIPFNILIYVAQLDSSFLLLQ